MNHGLILLNMCWQEIEKDKLFGCLSKYPGMTTKSLLPIQTIFMYLVPKLAKIKLIWSKFSLEVNIHLTNTFRKHTGSFKHLLICLFTH